MAKCIVTSSWDDGYALDERLLNLLNRYSIRGTFYIPKSFLKDSIGEETIMEIGKTHEVGAHTLNHVVLTDVSLKTAKREIEGSKGYLEELLGNKVKMFSYPKGERNENIKDLVREAGFLGARTTERFIINFPRDPYEMGTTIQVYPHPIETLARYRGRAIEDFRKMFRLSLSPKCYFSWETLAKSTFDLTYKRGGVWHVWGHSWEIEKYQKWEELERVFAYVSNKGNVEFLVNSECICY